MADFKYLIELYDDENYYDTAMHENLKKTVLTALKELNPQFDLSVSITIVSNEEIKELNRENRGVDKETDVLSFPMLEFESPEVLMYELSEYDYDPDTKCVFLGDIILSKEKIESQAEEYGHSLFRESTYLTLHGILHLMGYDHIEENDKKIMRSKEKEILNVLKIFRNNDEK